MNELLSFGALVALTIGVVEVIKRASGVQTKFIPLIALIVGFGLTLVGDLTGWATTTILTGIAVGLSSVGLFSQSKLIK